MAGPDGSGRTTPALIADALRHEVAHGLLRPGQALRQEDLAKRFGVSRIPVREALRQLEAEGLVEVHANRGAFVTSLTDADLVEIFGLRLLIEPDLARRAALAVTDSMLDKAEAAMLAAERGAATSDWSHLDAAFHRALYASAGHERQLAMVMALRGQLQRTTADEALQSSREAWMDDHRMILAACRARDGDKAALLVASHLARARVLARERLAASVGQSGTGLPYYDEARWRPAMLDLRPNCECCDRDLPNGDPEARICTFECTFCARCAEELFGSRCPNCGGNLVARPTRPEAWLAKAPPSRQRVLKNHPERTRLAGPSAGTPQEPRQSRGRS